MFYIIYILYIVYDILDIMYQILYIILSYSYKKIPMDMPQNY